MPSFDFLFQSSPWWIPVCFIVGAIYAFALYQAKPIWSTPINYLLAAGRFALVSLLCFLLLSWLLKQTRTSIEKKTVVLAIDNSQSLLSEGREQLKTALDELKQLQEDLLDKDFDVSLQLLDDQSVSAIDSAKFNRKTTNLADLLGSIKNNFEGRNLTDVVLLSDGIYNQGAAPTFGNYNFPIHTIGIGDTIPKRDVNLKTVYSNKIAYQGNQFPIQADVLANGFVGKTATVYLKQAERILDQKTVTFTQDGAVSQVNFLTTSTPKGLQHYTIEVSALAGEFSTRNNRQEVYIDIIDGKEKILLLALAPHPDLKAIRSIIDKNDNFELDVKILSQSPEIQSDKKYDLLILHQLPDYFNTYNEIVRRYINQGLPCLYILGNQTGMQQLNLLNPVIQMNAQAGQTDKVTGYFNPNFKLLNFDPERLEILKKFPPVSVPFGEYRLLPNTEVLLYQRVGTVQTQKPLLMVTSGAKRSALFLGEGLWSWRLEEFDLTEKQEVIDEIFTKVIQYISTKDDKRKLRVYPLNNEFILGDKVIFDTEVYNDIYEKLYNQSIKLDLTDERGKVRNYSYTNTEGNSRFEISGLSQGVYRYKATVTVLGKPEEVTGQFVVKDVQLEALNTTADFNLLRQLSLQTSGKFYGLQNITELRKYLTSRNLPDKIDATEELREPINLRWLFFVLMILATIEWVTRKYQGGY
ncbi:MAG: VWA domain-containing protein [Spirosomataceae bacterium]